MLQSERENGSQLNGSFASSQKIANAVETLSRKSNAPFSERLITPHFHLSVLRENHIQLYLLRFLNFFAHGTFLAIKK